MLEINLYNKEIHLESQFIKLIYNLGDVLDIDGKRLEPFEVTLVNSQEEVHIYPLGSKRFYAVYEINEQQLSRLFQFQQVLFFVDSKQSDKKHYKILKSCLANILLSHSDTHFLAQAEYQYHSYQLYLTLMRHFRISKYSLSEITLSDKLTAYIQKYFHEQLSLQTISSDFYMTPQYFSKIFKENMGENFHKYLTKTRISYAKNLLKKESGNLLQIALSSGFSNSSAFNRAFKESEKMSPSEYRKKCQVDRTSSLQMSFQEVSELLKEEIAIEEVNKERKMTIDMLHRQPVQSNWQTVCNIGSLPSLTSQETREQFQAFKDDIKIEFLRFELQCPHTEESEYAFYHMENELDFLVKLGFKFQIVINFRDLDKRPYFLQYLHQFIAHFSNRYSIDRIRKWRFELDYITLFTEEKCRSYGKAYQQILDVLTYFDFEEGLYGPGFIIGDVRSFQCFFDLMTKEEIPIIESLTFHVYPEVASQEDGAVTLQKVVDFDYVSNQLDILLQLIPEKGRNIRFHIVEWKHYLSYHSWIHDTTFKAANMIHNILSCYEKVSDIAIGTPLDSLFSENSGKLLSGAEGCVTRHGIYKPSFYSQLFLNRHGSDLLAKDEQSLVTSSGDNVTILSHHCSRLSYKYYLDDGNYYDYEEYFEEEDSQKIVYQINNLKPGTYLIKTRLINAECGSVREISEQVFGDDVITFGDSEISFLASQAVPHLTLRKEKVSSNHLTVTIEMKPNEIRHTHIIYLY